MKNASSYPTNLEKFGALSLQFLHDLSNDLTAISLNLYLVQKGLPSGHELEQPVNHVVTSFKALQQKAKRLSDWRNEFESPLEVLPIQNLRALISLPLNEENWTLSDGGLPHAIGEVKIIPVWLQLIVSRIIHFHPEGGRLELTITDNAQAEHLTTRQLHLTFCSELSEGKTLLPEKELALLAAFARAMNARIKQHPLITSSELIPETKKDRGVVLTLPIF